jgi:drug/metabolite transporter (DMT)-like permease
VNINPYFGMGWQMLFSSGMIAILALIKGNNLAFSEIPTNSWIAIAYLIVMGSLLAMMAFIYTMKHLPAPIASLYAYINPIVAIMIGTVVLDEHITWQLIVGTVITLLGVYLVNKSFKKATA